MTQADTSHEAWRATAERLTCEGWEIHWHRGWVVDARRKGYVERGVGTTLDEAFVELAQMVQLDQFEGCP